MRMPYVSEVLLPDKIAGLVLVALVLESCRRTVGVIVTIIALFFIGYGFFGPYMPGVFVHPGLSLNKFVDAMYMTTNGLFGSLVSMCATIIFAFISFGVFLQGTGGEKYFIDMALALAGKRPGGPAKVAILGSGSMGMISGSTIANIVTTGALTIPLMKRLGFRPSQAGAIEAVASSGGQVMPPIMGVGAFLIADAVGISFVEVAIVSLAPAVLFYIALWFFIDKLAKRQRLTGLEEVPRFWPTAAKSIHMLVPIAVLIGMSILKFTPFYAAVVSTILIYLMAFLHKDNRVSFKKFFLILQKCSLAMTSIIGVVAAAAVIVSIIDITGLMIKFTSIILSFSGGNIVLIILILIVVSYVMGMGLPVTSCYIIISALGVPALIQAGTSDIGAHLMIFWFAMLAGITPPVCVSAYVAAKVAEADPMKTGLNALKMGSMFYIIPMLFLFSNILTGSFLEISVISIVVAISFYFLTSGLEGYIVEDLSVFERLVSLAVFSLLFVSTFTQVPMPTKIVMVVCGLAIGSVLYWRQYRKVKELDRPKSMVST